MRQRQAFTLVELLVVITIISVLMALLLPAVQAAREAARATQCRNHFKQLGLALHQYHDTHSVLPPGWLADEPEGVPGWGWATHLLPYLEQQNLEQGLIKRHLPIADNANREARETVLSVFLCPSDPAPKRFTIFGGESEGGNLGGQAGRPPRRPPPPRRTESDRTEHVQGSDDEDEADDGPPLTDPIDAGIAFFPVARSNYVGVFGTLEIAENAAAADGTFFYCSRTRFAQVTDGLSNTFLVGERGAKRGGSLWQGVIKDANESLQRIVGTGDHSPNNRSQHFDDFTSYHPASVHFLHGDGSVSRYSNSINRAVYRALCTIGGGEVVKSK